ncbi:MAG TPA: prolipoprotein diacylglyceryl transferase family protein [Limnochordia bacterium]|nr:prolipoprotein diacylglyceryl transferase family protein [Limnochordia bacterium]
MGAVFSWINAHGLFAAIGFLTATYLAAARAERRGIVRDDTYRIAVLAMAAGAIGGRWLTVLSAPSLLPSNWSGFFSFPPGGVSHYPGLLAGLVAAGWLCRQRGVAAAVLADAAAPGVALGLALGNLGWELPDPSLSLATDVLIGPFLYILVEYGIFWWLWHRPRTLPQGALFCEFLILDAGAHLFIDATIGDPPGFSLTFLWFHAPSLFVLAAAVAMRYVLAHHRGAWPWEEASARSSERGGALGMGQWGVRRARAVYDVEAAVLPERYALPLQAAVQRGLLFVTSVVVLLLILWARFI